MGNKRQKKNADNVCKGDDDNKTDVVVVVD